MQCCYGSNGVFHTLLNATGFDALTPPGLIAFLFLSAALYVCGTLSWPLRPHAPVLEQVLLSEKKFGGVCAMFCAMRFGGGALEDARCKDVLIQRAALLRCAAVPSSDLTAGRRS